MKVEFSYSLQFIMKVEISLQFNIKVEFSIQLIDVKLYNNNFFLINLKMGRMIDRQMEIGMQ